MQNATTTHNCHKGDYYRLLLEVTTGRAWAPWIMYMLDGIEESASWTTDKMPRQSAVVD